MWKAPRNIGSLIYKKECSRTLNAGAFFSGIVPDELPATVIEKFHSLVNRVEDNPVVADGCFPLLTDSLDFSVAEVFKVVVVFRGQLMLSHFVSSFGFKNILC